MVPRFADCGLARHGSAQAGSGGGRTPSACSVWYWSAFAPRQWCNDNSGTPTMRPSQWKLKLSFKVAASSIRLISMMAALEGSGRRASTSTYSTRRSGNQSSLHLVPSANLNPLSELSVNTALTEGCAFASTGFAQGVPSEPALNLGACSATPEVASRHLLPHLGLVGRPRRPQPRVRPDAGA